ncbi:hypothetical protein AK812_SmicGene34927 [Symbiodinium microadriaticum]|uniref:Uncharacterized protein n=1 Tax=Symbiodinium microadriaticum TaxID=2951 RepID=A0A1Q9CMS9_SYMMI|nr:hypothetical protein AK812_SmicGene34927 [Symbiodinium microadriaticum]CAE7390420.1 unnamed protein product [Symbiodinium microadriaticum]
MAVFCRTMVLFAGAALAVILFSTWSFIDRGYTVCDQSVKVWVPIFAMGHLEMFRSWALIRHMRQHMFRTHPQLPVKSVVYLVREHKHSGHGRWHLQEDVEKDLEIAKDARKVHSRPESLVIFNGAWNGKTATLEQQYRIFNSAVVAFGPHGTGFSNVIWMPCEERSVSQSVNQWSWGLTNEAPGDITMNSSTGSGLDMYRRLHVRLDPADMVTSMRWLRSLMSTHLVDSVTDLVPAIEKWEDAHRRYNQRKDCTALTEQQKMVSLLGLAPSDLQGHLELNPGRLTSYDLLRRDMVSFADTKRAFTATDGAVPMEVDALKGAKGPKGKGGKKGDGHQGKGGQKEDREYFICFKKGHLARDCWHTKEVTRIRVTPDGLHVRFV